MDMASRANFRGTAEDLINAAERLFAESDSEPSLREIGQAAGSANKNAIQYHFGDRRGLIDAVFKSRLPLVESHRVRLLMEATPNGENLDLRQLLEILFRPIAELKSADGKRLFAGFLRKTADLRRDGELSRDITPMTIYIVHLIYANIEISDRAICQQRILACTRFFLQALSNFDSGNSVFSEEQTIEEALNQCAAILVTPLPSGIS
ncbi:MAG: hypothetical protein R3E02_16505 [Blastomonas sp.]